VYSLSWAGCEGTCSRPSPGSPRGRSPVVLPADIGDAERLQSAKCPAQSGACGRNLHQHCRGHPESSQSRHAGYCPCLAVKVLTPWFLAYGDLSGRATHLPFLAACGVQRRSLSRSPRYCWRLCRHGQCTSPAAAALAVAGSGSVEEGRACCRLSRVPCLTPDPVSSPLPPQSAKACLCRASHALLTVVLASCLVLAGFLEHSVAPDTGCPEPTAPSSLQPSKLATRACDHAPGPLPLRLQLHCTHLFLPPRRAEPCSNCLCSARACTGMYPAQRLQ